MSEIKFSDGIPDRKENYPMCRKIPCFSCGECQNAIVYPESCGISIHE